MTTDEFMMMCSRANKENRALVLRMLRALQRNNSAAEKVIYGFVNQCKEAQSGTIPRARFKEVLDEAEAAADMEGKPGR